MHFNCCEILITDIIMMIVRYYYDSIIVITIIITIKTNKKIIIPWFLAIEGISGTQTTVTESFWNVNGPY